MKKIYLLLLLFSCALQFSLAQVIIATGTVTNGEGVPVRYAFVQDKLAKSATYTDSLGTFRLTVTPSSKILITCNGYADASLDVAGSASYNVVLKADPASASAAASNNDLSVLNEAFKTHNAQVGIGSIGGLQGTTFSNIKETVGSRFLFNRWVHGYAVKSNGEIIQGSSILFNYDKMGGDLFLTENLNSALVADKNSIKSFVLFSPQDQPYTFERMMGISDNLYSQVISSGSKYKIYKLTVTKFIPSNYKTDGVVSTGNLYDEYADEYSYYIQDMTTLNYKPLSLRKKSIIEAFAPEGDKVTAYFSSHRGKIDEDYLRGLAAFMNQ